MFIPHNDVISSLQNTLSQNSQTKTPSQFGLKSAQIQTIFDSFYQSTLQKYSPDMQIYFAYRFLALHTPEEKRVGILTLSKNIAFLTHKHLDDFERIFDNDINDWIICDALANKVVTLFIRSHQEYCQRIFSWKDCGKNWRMRACCIIYVNFAKERTDDCISICTTCVKSSERFVQLGLGCLLREMSLNSTDKVVGFIYENYRYFTREGLRYSIEKLDISTRKKILGIGKGRNPGNIKTEPSPEPSPDLSQQMGVPAQIIQPQIQTIDDQLRAHIMSLDYSLNPQMDTYQVVMPDGTVNYVQQPTAGFVYPPNYSQYYADLQGFQQNTYNQ